MNIHAKISRIGGFIQESAVITMFLFLLVLFLLTLFILFLGNKAGNSSGQPHFILVLTAYVFSFLTVILFFSRQIYYVNIIDSYFMLPDFLWRFFFFFPIKTLPLICLVNFCSVSIPAVSVWYVGHLTHKKNLFFPVLFLEIVIFLFFLPYVQERMYYTLYPSFCTTVQYHGLIDLLTALMRVINCLIVFMSFIQLLCHHLHYPSIGGIRFTWIASDICHLALSSSYLLLLSIFPRNVLAFSKLTRTYSLMALPLLGKDRFYQLLPYLWTAFLIVLFICLARLMHLHLMASTCELEISRQLEDSENISRVFCHYIKNEILSLKAEVKASRDTPGSKEELMLHLDRIYARMDQIHQTSKITQLSFHTENAIDLIEQALEETAQLLSDYSVHRSYADACISILVDKDYFLQVLINIITNAAEAMRSNVRPGELTVSCEKTDQQIIITIKDNGKGISQRNLYQIFTPFFTTHPFSQNWGIGLSTSYKIMQLHSGSIKAVSEVGKGTSFYLLLPDLTSIL